jgi:malate dehydrogenase (oxaloacetate-decarboxylating)
MAAIGVSSRSSKRNSSTSNRGDFQGKRLSDQRYVIFGAGSAGMGIAVQVRDAMVAADGISREEANKRFWLIDREGLLYHREAQGESRGNGKHEWSKAKEEFVRPFSEKWSSVSSNAARDGTGNISLLEVIQSVKPTVLIGCSTAAGAFTEEIIRTMSNNLTNGEKPIVLPLSNPSRLVEALPEDIMKWTEGRALVATGSPFGEVKMSVEGEERVFR